jgi:hypothetical protein
MLVTYILASVLLFSSVLGQRCSTTWGIRDTNYLIENLKVDLGDWGESSAGGWQRGLNSLGVISLPTVG